MSIILHLIFSHFQDEFFNQRLARQNTRAEGIRACIDRWFSAEFDGIDSEAGEGVAIGVFGALSVLPCTREGEGHGRDGEGLRVIGVMERAVEVPAAIRQLESHHILAGAHVARDIRFVGEEI